MDLKLKTKSSFHYFNCERPWLVAVLESVRFEDRVERLDRRLNEIVMTSLQENKVTNNLTITLSHRFLISFFA